MWSGRRTDDPLRLAPSVAAVADIKFFFVVTGTEDKDRSPLGIPAMGDHRVREVGTRLINEKANADALLKATGIARFIHFNFENKKLQVFELDLSKAASPAKVFSKGSVPWKKLSDFVPTSGDTTFDPKTFVDDPGTGDFSIVHVYHSVRGAPQGSVLELAFLSHAWIEGPVLQNSDDNVRGTPQGIWPDGSQKRDPKDGDGRSRTDFEPNMGEDPTVISSGPIKSGGKGALAEFTSKFDPKGVIRVFGCNVQDAVDVPGQTQHAVIKSTVFQVLDQVITRPLLAAQGKLKPPDPALAAIGKELFKKNPRTGTFPIDMGYETDDEISRPRPPTHDHNTLLTLHFLVDPTFFGATPTNIINKSWKDVVQFIARQTTNSYVFKAAKATGLTCYGGAPGTGSDTEPKVPDPQMSIPMHDFGFIVWFFETFMGVSSEEPGAKVQRHYGVFDHATVEKLGTM